MDKIQYSPNTHPACYTACANIVVPSPDRRDKLFIPFWTVRLLVQHVTEGSTAVSKKLAQLTFSNIVFLLVRMKQFVRTTTKNNIFKQAGQNRFKVIR